MDVNKITPFKKSPTQAIMIHAIMIAFVLCLFSSFLHAQDLNLKITVSFKNKLLHEVIKEISEKGHINFSYSSQMIPLEKKISVKAKNKTIKEVLDKIFIDNGIDYTIVENQIVLKPLYLETNPEKLEKEKTKYSISGILKDKKTGEILIGATVFVKGTKIGVTSNAYGFFSITLNEGTYCLGFSFIGYKNNFLSVELHSNTSLKIELEETNIEMKAVEIKVKEEVDSSRHSQALSSMKLSLRTINQMPGFVGEIDIIKSLQSVPGIKSYGDGSALFYVRGGNSDQNMILIDEAPIYNPSHLFGFFTAISPEAIKDVEAYKGDFPSNYGGRLSSVIDIRMKDGNMKKMNFTGNIGLFTSSVTLEGPFKKEKSSFIVSGRKSNLNWLSLSNTGMKTLSVNFFDFNIKLNFKINNKNRLLYTFYSGNDAFSREDNLYTKTYGVSWSNILGTLRWNHIFNNKLFSNTTFYKSTYNYNLYLSKIFNEYWNSSISNSSLKSDFTYYANPQNTIKMGIEIQSHFSNPGNVHFADTSIQTAVPEIARYNTRELDLYFSHEKKINKKITIHYGIRIPIWENKGETRVYYFNVNHQVMDTVNMALNQVYYKYCSPEPRASIIYTLNEKSSLKLAYARTSQFVQLISNSTSPFTTLEVWIPCGPNIKPQKADQFSIGYFNDVFKTKYQFSAEFFYKYFMNQIDYKDHANLLFNPLIEGELRFGKTWSYGTEWMIRKNEGKLTGWIAYTFSRVYKETEGINQNKIYPASYDRPNDICINVSYRKRTRWSYSANWIYISGSAITTPTGFYYYNGYTVPIYDKKNNDRLPDYHRMDLSATLYLNKSTEKKYRHKLIFTLYNVYARNNPISVNFNKILSDNGKIVVPADLSGKNEIIPTKISVSGLIPSITYNFKF